MMLGGVKIRSASRRGRTGTDVPREVIPPSALDVESAGRRDFWVALPPTSGSVPHLIPLTVMVGTEAKPGKGLVVFGGTHGNEYEGPVAIKHLVRAIRTEEVLGRIIMVPVLNVAAFKTGSRENSADDGLNLNRAFVKGAGTSPALSSITHRIVAFVRDCIWPHVHMVIDLHSGGEALCCARYVSFTDHADPECAAKREEVARWFGTPLVVRRPIPNAKSGLLIDDAERQGKMTFGSELGWGASVDIRGVRYAQHGVVAAAIHDRQLGGKTLPIDHHLDGTQHLVEQGTEPAIVSAPHPGHYEPLVECGERVVLGQTVGYLHDFYRMDEEPHPIVAATDGFVIAQAWNARVEQGQTVVNVGREVHN